MKSTVVFRFSAALSKGMLLSVSVVRREAWGEMGTEGCVWHTGRCGSLPFGSDCSWSGLYTVSEGFFVIWYLSVQSCLFFKIARELNLMSDTKQTDTPASGKGTLLFENRLNIFLGFENAGSIVGALEGISHLPLLSVALDFLPRPT